MNRKDSQTKKLLRYLAIAGGVAALSVVAPLLPVQLMKAYVRSKRFEKRKFLQDLKRLQKRELVSVQEFSGGEVEVRLLKKGKEIALRYDFETMAIERPKRWDGRWRLVMFDIPRKHNKARDALRAKLRELGFYRLQQSVFLFPFPCEKEIDALTAFWGIRDFILLLNVSGFEGEEKLKRRFHLSSS